jgi:recombination protein RecT
MTQTVADAKAEQHQQQASGPGAVIEKYRPDLSIVLPSHIRADTWMRVAMGATRKSPQLRTACDASPETMMAALYEAARLGLEPGTDEYYLTPRRNKKGGWEVLGIVGYRGEVELMYRGGAVSSVIVCDVREGDIFQWRPGEMDRPTHHPRVGVGLEWFTADRGETVGAYAYAIMKDGTVSNVVIADQRRIKRAMDASATAGTAYSPWASDYGAMVLKTAAHDLEKWVPTSAEYRQALREDARAGTSLITPSKTAERLDQFLPPPGIVDGEIVDPESEQTAAAPTGEPAAAQADPADAASHLMGEMQKRRLFALLAEREIKSRDGRLRFANHALERDDLTSFGQLTANDASRLINQLEGLQRNSPAGPEQAPPPKEN